jgi:hypothetical protein
MTGVMSSQGMVPVPLLTVHGHVYHINGSEYHSWGPPWLPVLPEGSTCPSGKAETRRGGLGEVERCHPRHLLSPRPLRKAQVR